MGGQLSTSAHLEHSFQCSTTGPPAAFQPLESPMGRLEVTQLARARSSALRLSRCALASNATSADAALPRQEVSRVSRAAGIGAARRSDTLGSSRRPTCRHSEIDPTSTQHAARGRTNLVLPGRHGGLPPLLRRVHPDVDHPAAQPAHRAARQHLPHHVQCRLARVARAATPSRTPTRSTRRRSRAERKRDEHTEKLLEKVDAALAGRSGVGGSSSDPTVHAKLSELQAQVKGLTEAVLRMSAGRAPARACARLACVNVCRPVDLFREHKS